MRFHISVPVENMNVMEGGSKIIKCKGQVQFHAYCWTTSNLEMQSRLIFYNFKNKPENLRLYIHCLLNVKYIVNNKKKKSPDLEILKIYYQSRWLSGCSLWRGIVVSSLLRTLAVSNLRCKYRKRLFRRPTLSN